MPETTLIALERIATEGTQARVALSETVIAEYAEAFMQKEHTFPPIDVYFDGSTYWLADGFHRLKAAEQIGQATIEAVVHDGGRREAILHAVGANEEHGLRRTDADRRTAVLLLLNDPEWGEWSNRAIARQCHVSEKLVRRIRREVEPAAAKLVSKEARKVTRAGTEYTMRNGSIGATRERSVTASQTEDAEEPLPIGSAVPDELPQETVSVPAVPMESDVPAASLEPDSSITPAALPEPLSAAEPQIETAMPTTEADHPPVTAPGALPETPSAARPGAESNLADTVSVLSAEAAAKVSLSLAWAWATQVEREAFVAEYRDELRPIFMKLDKRNRQTAATP
jgi:hypothetical protein